MDADWEERMRVRAYYLWEQAGRPEGSEGAFWAEAERQMRAEASAASAAGTETWTGPGGSVGEEINPSTAPAAPETAAEPKAGKKTQRRQRT
jgi:DUF2934 family protein